jgi:hypothetical protein
MSEYLNDVAFGCSLWGTIGVLIVNFIKFTSGDSTPKIDNRIILVISLFGLVLPTIRLLSGNYNNQTLAQVSNNDRVRIAEIVNSCWQGEELSRETHYEFWALIKRNDLSQKAVKSLFMVFNNPDTILAKLYLYEDALETFQTGEIHESEKRLLLEQKLFTVFQMSKKQTYLENVRDSLPVNVNGVEIVLDKIICQKLIDSISAHYEIGALNIELLKNKKAFPDEKK